MKKGIGFILCICALLICTAVWMGASCGDNLENLFSVKIGGGDSDKIPGISLLAFSELAYRDWKVGETVYEHLESQWDDYFFSNDKDSSPRPRYRDLCQNIADWKVIRTSRDSNRLPLFSVGFYAVAFQEPEARGGRVAIAYRGSTMQSYEDFKDDWIENDFPFQVFHTYSEQLMQAQSFYEAVIREQELDTKKVTATGHSLGGALATVVSMQNGIYAETFNSASVYEALTYHKPLDVSEHFHGVDRINMLSRVIEGDAISNWEREYLHVPHISYYRDRGGVAVRKPKLNPMENHMLSAFVQYDSADRSFQLPWLNRFGDESAPTAAAPNDLALFLGTSGDDYVVRQPVKKHEEGKERAVLLGGDGNDTLISACASADILCGGNSTSFDYLDGGEGDDIYYYFKGNGIQIVQNSSGDDRLFLFGFSEDDSVAYYAEESFDIVTCNGAPIIYISGTHHEGATMSVTVCPAGDRWSWVKPIGLERGKIRYTQPEMSLNELKERLKNGNMLPGPDTREAEDQETDVRNAAADGVAIRDSGTCGEGVTWTLDMAGKMTISGIGEMDNYSSTSQIPWVSYGWDSTNNSDITSIVIEPGVTNIGDMAFISCLGVTSVQIPNTVTRIGESAFMQCIRLREVTIPASVKIIGANAFWFCQALERVEFTQGLEEIGNYAFYGCCLENVVLPSSVQSVGASVFGTWDY